MADKIQIRAGNKSGMPTLTDRELAYVRDEKALYVGTPAGNVKIGGDLEGKVTALELVVEGHDDDIEALTKKANSLEQTVNALSQKETALEQTVTAHENAIGTQSSAISAMQAAVGGKLTASPVAAQADIAADADLATAVAAVNALIAAMKSSGVMNN